MNSPALMMNNKCVLVVDDDQSIRKAVSAALSDEGYSVIVAESGDEALALLKAHNPDCVLLDIWMPGLDGLQTLSEIRQISESLPVIMISGHATIATAVKATRMGANNFIEKPLDLDAMLMAVQHAITSLEDLAANPNDLASSETEMAAIDSSVKLRLQPVVFTKKALLGEPVVQKTIAQPSILYGLGLHSGKKSGLILEPLPENSGIHFVGVSERTVVPAHVSFVESTGWATTLKAGDTQVATIEHLMSALHAYGISNLLIKCNGEVPVLDGSAKEFCALFNSIGVVQQESSDQWRTIVIKDRIKVAKNENEYIEIEPSDKFSIDYTLQYPAPINRQEYSFTLDSIEEYEKQIAPARTFGFVKDISNLQKHGLALGGRFDNFVLIGDNGPINSDFRFSDEPVRHKILDAIGDLYLLGRRIQGRVTAKMTGHSDNVNMCRAILAKMDEELV